MANNKGGGVVGGKPSPKKPASPPSFNVVCTSTSGDCNTPLKKDIRKDPRYIPAPKLPKVKRG